MGTPAVKWAIHHSDLWPPAHQLASRSHLLAITAPTLLTMLIILNCMTSLTEGMYMHNSNGMCHDVYVTIYSQTELFFQSIPLQLQGTVDINVTGEPLCSPTQWIPRGGESQHMTGISEFITISPFSSHSGLSISPTWRVCRNNGQCVLIWFLSF